MEDAAQNDKGPDLIESDTTPDSEFYILRLYVAGQTKKSLTAFANLKEICEEHLGGRYRIEVVDLLENSAASQRRPDTGCPNTWLERLPPT